MKVPLVDLKIQYQPLKEEIIAGFEEVLDSMYLFLGKNVKALESEFASFCGVEHAIGVGEGTTALHLILRAMEIGPGDEVITVSHTFIATAEAIQLAGARPVFVDIDPQTYLMDVAQVEAAITPRTKAILPVHLYGQTVDMDPLFEIANRHDLYVIEDACQAHGAAYKGRRAGGLGDAAAFSFYFSKNLGAFGEAGMVTTDNPDIAQRVRMLRDHGSPSKYNHEHLGMNARLDELQAVVLRAKLPHLEAWNQQRRQHAIRYAELLQDSPILTPFECPENEHVYHLYVIRTQARDEMLTWLKEQGVFAGIHYPVPIHLQPAMRSLGYQKGDFPVTERVVDGIISLPMYPELTEEQIEYVAQKVTQYPLDV
jgi:dTDP-4-amino-4,6-dideoxygalactose transaminase